MFCCLFKHLIHGPVKSLTYWTECFLSHKATHLSNRVGVGSREFLLWTDLWTLILFQSWISKLSLDHWVTSALHQRWKQFVFNTYLHHVLLNFFSIKWISIGENIAASSINFISSGSYWTVYMVLFIILYRVVRMFNSGDSISPLQRFLQNTKRTTKRVPHSS